MAPKTPNSPAGAKASRVYRVWRLPTGTCFLTLRGSERVAFAQASFFLTDFLNFLPAVAKVKRVSRAFSLADSVSQLLVGGGADEGQPGGNGEWSRIFQGRVAQMSVT